MLSTISSGEHPTQVVEVIVVLLLDPRATGTHELSQSSICAFLIPRSSLISPVSVQGGGGTESRYNAGNEAHDFDS